jgi:hypothetical protein
MTRAWHSVVRPAQTWVGETSCSCRPIRRYIGASPKSRDRGVRSAGAMLPRAAACRPGGIGLGRHRAPAPGDLIEEPDDLAQPPQVEEVLGCRRGGVVGWGEVVRAAQGDGSVAPVGEPDDEVGISSSAEANDRDALAAEGVMRMGDGDESRRRLG